MTLKGRRLVLDRIFTYGALTCAVVFALFPLAWALSTSLKLPNEVNAWPPTWIPNEITFVNWRAALSDRFARYVLNTLSVIVITLMVSAIVALHAAWISDRVKFKGKEALLAVLWATIMIPGVAIIVPLYMAAVAVGLNDTLFALVVVYSAWLVPTLVWLLRGFIAAIPFELEEAARIDGCSRLGALYRITVPLMRPGFVAAAIFVFVMIWNEFVIGYSLTVSDNVRLVQVGIYYFITEIGVEYGPLTAAALVSTVPILLLYAFLQRAFVQGLTGGAIK